MPAAQTCAKCGTPRTVAVLGGLCPACLGRVALDPAPAELEQFGDYQLQGEIARGGMGVVFKARQISLNRTVAVKMILAGIYAGVEEEQRFRAEAQIAARLRHPNIVAIHEIGLRDGRHFFSMEYVEGRNLAELAKAGPLSPIQAAQWVKTIAEAVQYAHQQGVLHRDLKPSNILIDDSGRPRITDFGVAKQIQAGTELTASGQVLGTPSFMPPEQAGGQRGAAGPHSDIYSLGALLYFLLTAKAPFAGSSLEETLLAVLHQEPPTPRALNPAAPLDLETICRKCMEKDPRRRYATAQELADELERFLRHEPIRARPVGPLGRLGRWSRRSPVTASLMISLLLTLAALVVLVWMRRPGRITAQRTPDLFAIDGTTLTLTNVGKANDCAVDETTGLYWTPTFEYKGLTIRDGKTDTVITNIKLDNCPFGVALDSVRRVAWVDSQCGSHYDSVWQIDMDTLKFIKAIRCDGVDGGPVALNPSTGDFYHHSGHGPERIDRVNLNPASTAFDGAIAVNSKANLLYTRGPADCIQIFDVSTNPEVLLTNVTQFPIIHSFDVRPGVSERLARLYLPILSSPRIAVLDGRSGQLLDTINLQEKHGRIKRIEGVAVDDSRNRVYAMATLEGDSGCLYVMDGNIQHFVTLPSPCRSPILDPTLNKIYLLMP